YPAQDRGDPQQQLTRLERLGQVVVGPGFKPADAVFGVAARGQQQDRGGHRLAQRFGQRDSVLIRHHHVEDEQVELEPSEQGTGMAGIPRWRDEEAVAGEELLQQIPDACIIIDDEDMRPRGLAHGRAPSLTPNTYSRSSGSIISSSTRRNPCTASGPAREKAVRIRLRCASVSSRSNAWTVSVRWRLRWRRSMMPTRLSTIRSSTSWRSTR